MQDVTLFDTHAYILLKDEESVPYCLALFSDIELHGRRLCINPKIRSKDVFTLRKHLVQVRDILKEQYRKIKPPNLPPKAPTSTGPKRGKKAEYKKNKRRDKKALNRDKKSINRDKNHRMGNKKWKSK